MKINLPVFILSLLFLAISAILLYQVWVVPEKFLRALKDPNNYWRTRFGFRHAPGSPESLLPYRIASIILLTFSILLLIMSFL